MKRNKLECLEYLEQSRKRAREKQGRSSSYKSDISNWIEERKTKLTDEFFKNLKEKEEELKMLSSSKISVLNSLSSKHRVKFSDNHYHLNPPSNSKAPPSSFQIKVESDQKENK